MPVQTTYSYVSSSLIAGQIADNGHREVNSVIAEAAIAAGIVGIRGSTTRTEVRPPTSPDAADVDGLPPGLRFRDQMVSAAELERVVAADERDVECIPRDRVDGGAVLQDERGREVGGPDAREPRQRPRDGRLVVSDDVGRDGEQAASGVLPRQPREPRAVADVGD